MTVVALEELQAKSRFIRDVVLNRCVYAVEGTTGFARVDSPRRRGIQVELLWTNPAEAARWADVLVEAPRVTILTIEMLLSRRLPKLAQEGRLVGTDWSDVPVEPEMAATDLDTQLRRRMIDDFSEQAAKNRQVWILRNGESYATIVTRHPAGGETLPVFADRASAERAMDGPWSQMSPARVSLADFLQKTVLWCVETRRRIAPAYVPGPGLVEMHAWEMKALLSGHSPARRRVV
jgi:hypothetical protein